MLCINIQQKPIHYIQHQLSPKNYERERISRSPIVWSCLELSLSDRAARPGSSGHVRTCHSQQLGHGKY